MAADNVSLGMFTLSGIPPAPRGVPKIEVTFDIDANGILHVSAKDLATGKDAKITITASTKLSNEEKERMVREAEMYAEQDRKRLEEANLRNEADSLLYSVEKVKSELGDKVGAEALGKLNEAAGKLREALAGKDVDAIRSALEALKKAAAEVGSAAYQSAAGAEAQPRGAGAGTGGGTGRVYDVEGGASDKGSGG